jgi:hypothetical protein
MLGAALPKEAQQACKAPFRSPTRNTPLSTIFTVAEEAIFAMEYRKVERHWLSEEVEKALLEQANRWEIFWEMRSKIERESAEEKRIVELTLTDADAEDVEDAESMFVGDSEE